MNPAMNEAKSQKDTGFAGMGRWIAVASELPCSIIIMLYIGHFLGTSWWGPQGGMWGGLVGAVIGFFFGVWSVYATVGYYDRLETQSETKRTWQPSPEEIHEEFDFSDEMDRSKKH